MTYKVVKKFTDLQDNCHVYNVGDAFPRIGVYATEKRIAQLAGSENRQGQPLIAAEKPPVIPAKPSVSPIEAPKAVEGINKPKRGRKPKKAKIEGDNDDI